MASKSIKFKLVSLCTMLLTLLVAVGGVEYYGETMLAEKLSIMANTQLPAVRAMATIDMMHDGLRAVVYRAIAASESVDNEVRTEINNDFKEMETRVQENIEELDKLPLNESTVKAIADSKPEIKTYLNVVKETIHLVNSKKNAGFQNKLQEFEKSFKDLEDKLEKLGDLIDKDTEDIRTNSLRLSETLGLVGKLMILLGLLLGIISSYWLVRDLVRTLNNIISELLRSSQEVSSSSSQSASTATELSEAATEQASSLQQTMASVEEISAMVSQNAESANKVKLTVDTNQKTSDEGVRSVEAMMRAIDEIKATNDRILSQMNSSNKEFVEIIKIISGINEKTKVINDIVFQTKLLSFNASVEAARAGEHGKGFAVVAEEVGNLAQMSGTAAKEIGEILSESIKQVNTIVESTTEKVDELIELGKDKISMGLTTADKCRDALQKISENAKTVASMVTEIAHASKEQAQGVQEINKAILQLDQVTQQNSTVAQSSSSQAEQLNSEAEALSETVNRLIRIVGHDDHEKNNFENSKQISKAKSKRAKDTKSNFIASVTQLSSKKQLHENNIHNQSEQKVAVGSKEVPSSNNPNFEEF